VAVSNVTGVSGVAAGGAFACALFSAGGFQCWGSNAQGQITGQSGAIQTSPLLIQPTSLNQVVAVAGGNAHTCVLWDTGSVKCWGSNTRGQLGNGTTTSSSSPVDVLGITTATAIASGYSHTCARLSDGTIKCWGDDTYGQLGTGGSSGNLRSTPAAVSGISNATSIGLGTRHSCAVLSDSTAKCWGRNKSGELGSGSTSNTNTPVVVSGLSGATAIGGGGDNASDSMFSHGIAHTCALLSTGAVKCWGENDYGELGTGNTTDSTTPAAVSGLSSGATALTLGMYSSCALISDNTVKCWGRNNYGQLGNGATTNSSSPVTVSNLTAAAAIGTGSSANHVCARLTNKTVQCWGYNASGQLGNGSTANSNVPVISTNATHTVGVSGGEQHSCAALDDATLLCWGSNASGQLALDVQDTYTTNTSMPCRSMSVARSDYFVAITTANMPDPALDGMSANLDVHRVSPVLFPESCTPQKALVLVHGRTVEASSAFDLQYQNYSFQETMAMAGIDTFAMNHLGYGLSSGLGVMNDACNASLPLCTDIGQTCPPPTGVLCDCGPVPTFGVNDRNQQGSTRYLNPNPLTSLCAHTTNTRLNSTTTLVADVDAVVDDALAKTGLAKVNILGYSAGGIDVGNWLGEADDTTRAARLAKVERAIFVSSLFGLPQVTATEPTAGNQVHSFPMGVMDRNSATQGGFNLGGTECPGQRDENIVGPIWASVRARDPVGSTWGPSQTPPENGGLSRFPHATRWGWNATSAARITIPVLVMQGLKDNVVPVASSAALYDALTGTSSRAITQIGCGSHSIFWEGCSGGACNGWTGAHETIAKNARDWILSGMIYASPGSENGSFESSGTDGVNAHTEAPTTSGPVADESNQLP
jgi:alpha-tubulin suppressor-like RCC1 family protein/alpha-beta hydrolase superfamily lysophospholipase